jgi:putative ABC transport system ATP-binding protein
MPTIEPPPALSFENVSKTFLVSGDVPLAALRHVTFRIPQGRKVAIIGRSGSGKSTLLHLSAGIEWPSEGAIRLMGRDLAGLGDRERTLLRRETVGLVFQFFHLLSHLSVRDNVLLPAWIASDMGPAAESRAEELLAKVGLAGRLDDPIQKLSGGEMQRVAICRALLRKPKLLLADEPTGSLDDENGRVVMEQLLSLSSQEGATLVYVTHSPELAALADETWTLHSGLLKMPGGPL